jgi:hypothetical protein
MMLIITMCSLLQSLLKERTLASRQTFVPAGSLHLHAIILLEIQSRDIHHHDVIRVAIDPLDRSAAPSSPSSTTAKYQPYRSLSKKCLTISSRSNLIPNL